MPDYLKTARDIKLDARWELDLPLNLDDGRLAICTPKIFLSEVPESSCWIPILSKYPLAFVSKCENAMKLAREIMVNNLSENMFADSPEPVKTAENLVEKLISVDFSKTHNRHLHISQLKELGVKVTQLEDDHELQDILLTVHHCYMHSLSGSNLLKAVENHTGQGILRHIDVNK